MTEIFWSLGTFYEKMCDFSQSEDLGVEQSMNCNAGRTVGSTFFGKLASSFP